MPPNCLFQLHTDPTHRSKDKFTYSIFNTLFHIQFQYPKVFLPYWSLKPIFLQKKITYTHKPSHNSTLGIEIFRLSYRGETHHAMYCRFPIRIATKLLERIYSLIILTWSLTIHIPVRSLKCLFVEVNNSKTYFAINFLKSVGVWSSLTNIVNVSETTRRQESSSKVYLYEDSKIKSSILLAYNLVHIFLNYLFSYSTKIPCNIVIPN